MSVPQPLVVFPGKIAAPGLLTKVDEEQTFNFFGRFDARALSLSAARFIVERSDGSLDGLEAALSAFLALASSDCRSTSDPLDASLVVAACWLCVRMSQPADDFVEPRWHNDGRMFDCSCVSQLPHSKYAVSLLGPSTRILCPGDRLDAATEGVGDWHESRAELAERLEGSPEVTIERGQAIRFSWGQADSPVHSEPDSSSEDRVFVSVLFGMEEEIRDMSVYRGEEFSEN